MIIKTSYPFMKPPPSTRLIRGHRLSQGLVGLWLFNEGSGNIVSDLSGNGNVGTFVNTPAWVPGKFGSAIDFIRADSDYIDVLNLPELFIIPPCTMIIWFKCDVLPSTTADEYTLFRYAEIVNNAKRYQIRLQDSNDKIEGQVSGGSAMYSVDAIVVDRWYQATLVSYTSTNHQIFLDTVAGDTDSVAFPDILSTPELRFGVNYFSGLRDFMLGQISHVLIYNRALTASEIAELYLKPFAMFERKARTALMSGYEVVAPPVGMAGAMTTNTGFWGY